ncbi:uncharacterized protein LOC131601578 [Vicia villosa]|uniref:uncharacterized protein LOC131601578 n=1 Tax=Vicia villosa TaxID=3911 RepID=UPI00273C8CFD|nr:uncharacterized protein LOC131601578 [Vicia villosa]
MRLNETFIKLLFIPPHLQHMASIRRKPVSVFRPAKVTHEKAIPSSIWNNTAPKLKRQLTVPRAAAREVPFSGTHNCQQQTTTDPIAAEPDFYLPDDCWEYVFSFLDGDFNSLSRVSKHFLSITIRLTLSINISHPSHSLLSYLFHKFYNLNSLEISFHSLDLDAGIALALRDTLTLKSLSIAWIEFNHVTSQNIDSFVSLKGLSSLKFYRSKISNDLLYSIARESLPLKRFVLEECIGYSYNAKCLSGWGLFRGYP